MIVEGTPVNPVTLASRKVIDRTGQLEEWEQCSERWTGAVRRKGTAVGEGAGELMWGEQGTKQL